MHHGKKPGPVTVACLGQLPAGLRSFLTEPGLKHVARTLKDCGCGIVGRLV